jgi:RND family efflux transporter MFP subunit
MNRKFLRSSHYCLLFVLGLFLIACDEQNITTADAPRPVKAFQIGNIKSFNNRSFPGRAKASQEVNLSFNVSGSLTKLPIKIGDKIKKGALIAQLDPRDFEAKLKSAVAEETRDEQNYQRAKALVGKGHISKADFDLLQAKYAVSKSNKEIAEKALNDSVIKAPFDGQIANLYAENYQAVASKEVIARLLDISHIEMVIQIPENIISLIPSAKNIVVEFDAYPKHLIPAQIKEISNEASADTRTYPVTIIMNQPQDFEILPGMSGKVMGQIKQEDMDHKVFLPASALMSEGDNSTYVWVVNPQSQQVHRQKIQIGELSSAGVSVLSGLNAGVWVVTAGIHSLKENEKVIILNQ